MSLNLINYLFSFRFLYVHVMIGAPFETQKEKIGLNLINYSDSFLYMQ